MQDAVLVDHGKYYDIEFDDNGDILTEDSLDSSILVSLLVEKRAEPYEVAEPERRGGWIGNANAEHQIGSKIWLYRQSKLIQSTLNGIKQEIEAALRFFVDDGLLSQINVTMSSSGGSVFAEITMLRFSNQIDKRLYELWNNTGE